MRSLVLLGILALVLAAPAVQASCGNCPGDAPKGAELCPVTGKPVDPAITLEFGKKTYSFCCPKCVPEFKAHPLKYMKAARLQEAAEGKGSEAKWDGRKPGKCACKCGCAKTGKCECKDCKCQHKRHGRYGRRDRKHKECKCACAKDGKCECKAKGDCKCRDCWCQKKFHKKHKKCACACAKDGKCECKGKCDCKDCWCQKKRGKGGCRCGMGGGCKCGQKGQVCPVTGKTGKCPWAGKPGPEKCPVTGKTGKCPVFGKRMGKCPCGGKGQCKCMQKGGVCPVTGKTGTCPWAGKPGPQKCPVTGKAGTCPVFGKGKACGPGCTAPCCAGK